MFIENLFTIFAMKKNISEFGGSISHIWKKGCLNYGGDFMKRLHNLWSELEQKNKTSQFSSSLGEGQLDNDRKQMGLGIERKINIPGYFFPFHLRAIQQK